MRIDIINLSPSTRDGIIDEIETGLISSEVAKENLFHAVTMVVSGDIIVEGGDFRFTLVGVRVVSFLSDMYSALVGLAFHSCSDTEVKLLTANEPMDTIENYVVTKRVGNEYKLKIASATNKSIYDGAGKLLKLRTNHFFTVNAMEMNNAIGVAYKALIRDLSDILDEVDGVERFFALAPYLVACGIDEQDE